MNPQELCIVGNELEHVLQYFHESCSHEGIKDASPVNSISLILHTKYMEI
jgi:hypothetical protein